MFEAHLCCHFIELKLFNDFFIWSADGSINNAGKFKIKFGIELLIIIFLQIIVGTEIN
jgi:hypothetical protein